MITIGLQLRLRREIGGRHDHGVHLPQHRRGRIERGRERPRIGEIARGHCNVLAALTRADIEIARAAFELGDIAAEQAQPIAACGELTRDRTADALARADNDNRHG
jgi:hypothetical protein